MKEDRTVIIGGGVIGLCTAYYLARRGRQVTVLDRGPAGDSASGGNAGILAAGHLPLPQPGLALKAMRWMLDRNSPLYIPIRFDLEMYRWFWDFNLACNQRTMEYSMETLTPLGRMTMVCWEALLAEEKIACDYRPVGWMHVYRTEPGGVEAEHEAELMERLGFAVERYDGDALRHREPAYGPKVQGAAHFTDSASLDPVAFLKELGSRVQALGGVLETGAEVDSLVIEGGRCAGARLTSGEEVRGASTVLAAGIWSTGLARSAGLKVPMQGGKGYHLDLAMPERALGTAAVLGERFIAVTPMGDRLRLAGTVEFSGLNRNLVQTRVDMLVTGSSGYLQGVEGARVIGKGCDLRPCTADGLPVLGMASGLEDLLISTGGAKMGLTLGPALGQIGAEMLLDRKTSLDVAALRVDRF